MSSNDAGKAEGYIGKGMPRAATRRLVSGRGRYVDDISLKGELHAAFLRSPRPHASFKILETTEAKAVDGVIAVRGLDLQTGFLFPLRIHYGVIRFPPAPRFKAPQGCAGRRHDPGPGAYFELNSLNLSPSFAGAA